MGAAWAEAFKHGSPRQEDLPRGMDLAHHGCFVTAPRTRTCSSLSDSFIEKEIEAYKKLDEFDVAWAKWKSDLGRYCAEGKNEGNRAWRTIHLIAQDNARTLRKANKMDQIHIGEDASAPYERARDAFIALGNSHKEYAAQYTRFINDDDFVRRANPMSAAPDSQKCRTTFQFGKAAYCHQPFTHDTGMHYYTSNDEMLAFHCQTDSDSD